MKIKISHILLSCDTGKTLVHIFAQLLIIVQKQPFATKTNVSAIAGR